MYRLGLGCPKDAKKSFYYYNLSLELPINNAHLWAQYNLAKYFYLNGNYEANIEKDEPKALNLLNNSSTKGLIEASLELLYYYTNNYFQTKNKELLTQINNIIPKIEQHPNFNETTKKEIEKNISNLKTRISLNKDLFHLKEE